MCSLKHSSNVSIQKLFRLSLFLFITHKYCHLTGAVHLSPQEYFDFLKENMVAQQVLKVLRNGFCPIPHLLRNGSQPILHSATSPKSKGPLAGIFCVVRDCRRICFLRKKEQESKRLSLTSPLYLKTKQNGRTFYNEAYNVYVCRFRK